MQQYLKINDWCNRMSPTAKYTIWYKWYPGPFNERAVFK